MSFGDDTLDPANRDGPTLRDLQRRHFEECGVANWDPRRKNTFAEECAHLHEEVTEAFKAWRVHRDFGIHWEGARPTGVPIELADVLIGIFYNAELHGIDLVEALRVKGEFNRKRDYVAEGRQLHERPVAKREAKSSILDQMVAAEREAEEACDRAMEEDQRRLLDQVRADEESGRFYGPDSFGGSDYDPPA